MHASMKPCCMDHVGTAVCPASTLGPRDADSMCKPLCQLHTHSHKCKQVSCLLQKPCLTGAQSHAMPQQPSRPEGYLPAVGCLSTWFV
jgi:hypothetical protein